MSKTVLIVEDDAAIATVIAEALREEGLSVTACTGVARRDELLASETFDVMLTDVILADGDGLATLGSAQKLAPDMPVIVLSAQNTFDTAVRASDVEAFAYFPKPFDLDELTRAVMQAVAAPAEIAGPGDGPLDGQGEGQGEGLPFIGRSAAMQDVYQLITRVLRNDLTVLVTGETGTGKELVAEAIHQLGPRRKNALVALNAAAIPQELIESELFGHEKGAFTGATAQAIGKFEQASGGTLFLDEIGDMPAAAQTRLLRALQSGRIRRVGGREEIAVDVRIIAATNRALEPMIAAGTFREDLYYRLAVVPIPLPPLRDRKEDLAALSAHFLRQAEGQGLPRRTISRDAIAALSRHSWPGNVRELRNVIFRLALMSRDDTIDEATVAAVLEGAASPDRAAGAPDFGAALDHWVSGRTVAQGTLYQSALAAFERPLFELALRRTDGNQLRAAELLGINRNTLRKRLGELDIRPETFAKPR